MNKTMTREELEAAYGKLMLETLRAQDNPALGVKKLPNNSGGNTSNKTSRYETLVTLARTAVAGDLFTIPDISRHLGVNNNVSRTIVKKMNDEHSLVEHDTVKGRRVWQVTNPASRDLTVMNRVRTFLSKHPRDTFTTLDVRAMFGVGPAPGIRVATAASALGLIEDTGERVGRSGKAVVWRIVGRP